MSLSETLRRCVTCGHWAKPTRIVCPSCGIPYEAAPLVGLEPVRESDTRGR